MQCNKFTSRFTSDPPYGGVGELVNFRNETLARDSYLIGGYVQPRCPGESHFALARSAKRPPSVVEVAAHRAEETDAL